MKLRRSITKTETCDKCIALSHNGNYLNFARIPNKKRDFQEAKQRFLKFYFNDGRVYSERDFERHFTIPRILYERIKNCIVGCNDLFPLRIDPSTEEGISPEVRLIACIGLPAYGCSFDQIDEFCYISESTWRESFTSFVNEIVIQFGKEYLRNPNESNLPRILQIIEGRGFLEWIGSWDCQDWQWKNCPLACTG